MDAPRIRHASRSHVRTQPPITHALYVARLNAPLQRTSQFAVTRIQFLLGVTLDLHGVFVYRDAQSLLNLRRQFWYA